MFYDTFKVLCDERHVSCKAAAIDMGFSNSISAKWKKTGATPQGETLNKIAEYFNVSTDYLLGKENKPATNEGDGFSKETLIFAEKVSRLSPEKIKMLRDYMEYLESKGDQ